MQQQTARQTLQGDLAQGHVSLEACQRAAALERAKESSSLLHDMLHELHIQQLFEPLANANSFTGFRNFNGCSCYMNVLLQLFCQTDILTEYFAGNSDGNQVFKRLLADVCRHHGRYECIAPFEILELLLTSLEPQGVLTNRQNDAVEVLELMMQRLMHMPTQSDHVVFKFARRIQQGSVHVAESKALQSFLKESFTGESEHSPAKPRRLLLSMPVLRFCSADDLAWIPYSCTNWNDDLDMSWLVSADADASYFAKAAIFHIHEPADLADTTCGHYVIVVKHGNTWHMSNDSVVRPISFESSPCVPCAVYLERTDGPSLPKAPLPNASERLLTWEEALTTAEPDPATALPGKDKRPEHHLGQSASDTPALKKHRTDVSNL